MKMIKATTLQISILLAIIYTCLGQFYHQPIPYTLQQRDPRILISPEGSQFTHRAVIDNAIRESELPPELIRSSRFYNNPKIATGLAKDSWFTDKEMPVFDREAEKIPREQVYKIFKNAGFIQRRRR